MRILLMAVLLSISVRALGTLSIGESGDVIAPGTYQLGLEPTFSANPGDGFNVGLFGDFGINDSLSTRVGFGSGGLDFFTSASLKWVPFPDLDTQPAIGGKASLIYMNDKDFSLTILRVAPLISKRYTIEPGTILPYVALPVLLNVAKDKTYVGTSLAAGTEFIHRELDDFKFFAEVSVDLHDGMGYFSLGGIMGFDDQFRPRQRSQY